ADAAIELMDEYLEIGIGIEDAARIVYPYAGIEDRQGTLAEQLIGTAGTDFTEFAHFALGQHFHAAPGGYCGVNLMCRHCCFRLIWTVILRHSRPRVQSRPCASAFRRLGLSGRSPSGACHAR